MHASTMTTKGQVTIPLAYRKQMGLTPGTQVVFLAETGKMVIKPVTKDITTAFGLIKAKHHVSVSKMEEIVRKRTAKREFLQQSAVVTFDKRFTKLIKQFSRQESIF